MAAHNRLSTVALLLAEGADPSERHATYSTPLLATLEACAAEKLSHCHALDIEDKAYLLDMAGYKRQLLVDQENFSHREVASFKEIVRLLLKRGACASGPPGRFGSVLALAAFQRWDDLTDDLLAHDACASSAGRILPCALLVAIDQGSIEIVRRLLNVGIKDGTVVDPEGIALHRACDKADLTIVKLLLQHGYSHDGRDEQGRSALFNIFKKLRSLHEKRFRRLGHEASSHAHELSMTRNIMQVFLSLDLLDPIPDEDLVAACDIAGLDSEQTIFESILARWNGSEFPEEGLYHLVKNSRRERAGAWEVHLEGKYKLKISTRVLASARDARCVKKLL